MLCLRFLTTSISLLQLEKVTKKQHEYVTSPTNDDFHTQLNNINNQIDDIVPPSASSKTRKSMPGKGSNSLPTATSVNDPKSAGPAFLAQKCYFFKQPKDNHSTSLPREQERTSVPSSTERKLTITESNFKTPHRNKSGQSSSSKVDNNGFKPQFTEGITLSQSKKAEGVTPITSPAKKLAMMNESSFKTPAVTRIDKMNSSTKKLALIGESSYKTPFMKRSDQIKSIRDKLRMLTEEKGSKEDFVTPVSSSAKRLASTKTLSLIPNPTRATAQKNYFFKSPTSQENANVNGEVQPPPQSPSECSLKENAVSNEKQGKRQLLTPSLPPRQIAAYERHVSSMRKHKNKDISPSENSERSESSQKTAPSPREMKAYEKHIQQMRERLKKDSPTGLRNCRL